MQVYFARLETMVRLSREEWQALPCHDRIYVRSCGTVHEHLDHVHVNVDNVYWPRIKHFFPDLENCPVVGVTPLS